MENSLTKLELEIPDGETVGIIEGPHPFPPPGGVMYLHCLQSFNLRKLRVSCRGPGFQPCWNFSQWPPCLKRLINTTSGSSNLEKPYLPWLSSTHTRSFSRNMSKAPSPSHLSCHPNHTKIVLVWYLPDSHGHLDSQVIPPGMQLPIPTRPKHVQYRIVHHEEPSETSACIDLISVDGRHTLIENCDRWAKGCSVQELDGPRLELLQTIDLPSVEKSCFESCSPDPTVVEKILGTMGKPETLLVVNCNPYIIFDGMHDPPNLISRLMRPSVARYDRDVYTQWEQITEEVETRAAHGSPTLILILGGIPLGGSGGRSSRF